MKRWWALLIVGGCHGPGAAARQSWTVPLVADAPADDDVIATVDGRPIRASQVAAQARAAAQSPRDALDALVTAELLASEAVRRGLGADPQALLASRQSAVQRLLAVGFEREITPANIPERAVEKVYNQNDLDHGVRINVSHLLVMVGKKATPAERADALALAADLAKRARGVGSQEAFRALAQVAPARIKVENLRTERDGWTERAFSYAAFDQLKKPGDTTGVVETSYGYHVIYLNGYEPALHVPMATAEPKLREGMFPDFQKHEFARWADRLAGSHSVEEHPERLPAEGASP